MKTQTITFKNTTIARDLETPGYYSMTYNGASDLRNRIAETSFEKEIAQLLDSNLPKARHIIRVTQQLLNMDQFTNIETPVRIEVQHDFWIKKGPNEQHGALVQITNVENPSNHELMGVFI